MLIDKTSHPSFPKIDILLSLHGLKLLTINGRISPLSTYHDTLIREKHKTFESEKNG